MASLKGMSLHFAAQSGNISEVEKLVNLGYDVNSQDENGNTPLKYASAEPCSKTLQKLIDLGADVNLEDSRGFTPLHCVSGHGFYSEAGTMAEILLESGADINARSRELGFTPLHEVRTKRMIDLLISWGADPFIRNLQGQTPLEYLIIDQQRKEAKHLRLRMEVDP